MAIILYRKFKQPKKNREPNDVYLHSKQPR